MRIYQMTATFGKLEHETLTLKPGLNIISAPNEWGKSTWCAFLVAMLYGLDTRAKTTRTALADKERYAPWSGAPMSGRIDLNWNGRDITIERTTRRRVPLGEFKAYETESGLSVPELTAANCGQMLLGVEQSVFRRSGFIRHADLPVTQDEALRRRLNALVTTGDESGAADRLADQLKELKNRCRYNRSGLLPQAEAERDALETRIAELETLETQSETLKHRLEELKTMLSQLRNHHQTLAYVKSQADAARVEQAKLHRDQVQQELQVREEACAQLPSKEEALEMVQQLRSLKEQWNALTLEEQQLPQEPKLPQQEGPFAGMTAEEALVMVRRDAETYTAAAGTRAPRLLIAMGVVGLAVAGFLVYLMAYLYAGVAGAAALVSLVWGVYETFNLKKTASTLVEKYGDDNYKRWALPIREYQRKLEDFEADRKEYQQQRHDLEVRWMVLRRNRETLCGERDMEEMLEMWRYGASQWDALYAVRKEAANAQRHLEALNAMVKIVEKPTMPDHLIQSEAETVRLIHECTVEQQRLQNRLGQYQGRMETLGNKQAMEKQRERQIRRIAKLEDTYAALTIAQETLEQARAELQRRFAPRITKRAQELLQRMTAGRYTGLTMGQDFSLQAKAGTEDTLHDAIWRSDGTMDQLYLALRLAVAEELTPEAPLILDDALVCFDGKRMKAAVEILRELSKEKQIILFTCQGREAQA